jgi:hypothetical protein
MLKHLIRPYNIVVALQLNCWKPACKRTIRVVNVNVDLIICTICNICNICSCTHKHVDINFILKFASTQILFAIRILNNEPFWLILNDFKNILGQL